MAITVTKQPSLFFNSTNPVIFEFTTDSLVGNYDDYLVDVVITSEWRNATAVIKNIPPNTNTKVFSVNCQDIFKALQLKDFNYNFLQNKNFAIEKFSTSLIVKNGALPDDNSYYFDGYTFDDFVFIENSNQLDEYTGIFFSMLGSRNLLDPFFNPANPSVNTILAAEYIELCAGFNNYISIFQNERGLNTININGYSTSIAETNGVGTALLTDQQINSVAGISEITINNRNLLYKNFALNFRPILCNPILQFRFFNKYGGFSFFYAQIDSQDASRQNVEFYNNYYYNENENVSPQIQASAKYSTELTLKGNKNKLLLGLFDDLLRSPKVEVNLKQFNGNDFFIETEINGSFAKQLLTFDYILKIKI